MSLRWASHFWLCSKFHFSQEENLFWVLGWGGPKKGHAPPPSRVGEQRTACVMCRGLCISDHFGMRLWVPIRIGIWGHPRYPPRDPRAPFRGIRRAVQPFASVRKGSHSSRTSRSTASGARGLRTSAGEQGTGGGGGGGVALHTGRCAMLQQRHGAGGFRAPGGHIRWIGAGWAVMSCDDGPAAARVWAPGTEPEGGRCTT